MKTRLLATAAWLCSAFAATAGGYLTNTNQSVAFLRNPARNAYISIDGAYTNPAGLGFMSEGWHVGLNIQSAFQTRSIDTKFGTVLPGGTTLFPFALGTVNGVKNPTNGEKHFEGKATAPVIPSIDLARIIGPWSLTFHLGVTGGGGKCTFDEGLGSFESAVSTIPVLVNSLAPGAVNGYSVDTHLEGRQYYYGGQFGVGYKVKPNLNVNVGGRAVYALTNYYGYVRNIGLNVNTPAGAINMPAATFFTSQGMPQYATLVGDKEINCDQSGWGFTPIIGVHWRATDKLDLAARYEFKTRIRLTNKSGVNTSGVEEFDDGKKVAADLPAILSLGAKYDILPSLRASLGYHMYFDKQATQYANKEKKLDGNGWEVLAGLEYDANKYLTLSAGWQSTSYGLGENSQFISDLSFVTNSNSIGAGVRVKLKERVHLNAAYFKTIYQHYERNSEKAISQTVSLPYLENFHRTNDVFGLSVDIDI